MKVWLQQHTQFDCLFLKIDTDYEEFGWKSPQEVVKEIMGKNFPTLDITKKVSAVEHHFLRLHEYQEEDDEDANIDSEKTKQLQESLQYSMKGSRFSELFQKYLRLHKHDDSSAPAGFSSVTIMISQALAAKSRHQLDEKRGTVKITSGLHTIYVTEHGVFSNFVQQCVVQSAHSQVLSVLNDRSSAVLITPEMLVYDVSIDMISDLLHESQQNFARVLKDISLDPENHDSPWNRLPVFFNLEDEARFSEVRSILIQTIREAFTCLHVMSHDCQVNKTQFSCSQMFYMIKNLYPQSASNLLPTLTLLISLAENNFQMIDRMFSDAIYSTLFTIFDSLRNTTSVLFSALLTNEEGFVDFYQQCRVLEYVFKKPLHASGKIIVPRVWSSTENGKITSCRQFLDRKFAILKMHNKPFPQDHPFAFIKPPSWALDADGQRRSFIEPWDTLTGIVRRVAGDFRSGLYGEYCPYGSLMLHFLEDENDCLKDFNYWSNIQNIEEEWMAVHADVGISREIVNRKELELKRDWWYCTMIYSLQFLSSCYSLVAKLCENRNLEAKDFFCGFSKLKKEEFFVQTWGTRPHIPIVSHEGSDINDPQTHKSVVRFNNDGLSTVTAVTCVKPLNPTCAFEVTFPSRSFMYYEVSIDSIQDPESAVLAIGWTIANRERNADEPSDSTGVGYPSHSWSVDGIRRLTYLNATKTLRPSMELFLFDLEQKLKIADDNRQKLLEKDCRVQQNIDELAVAEHDYRIIAFQVKNKREILDQLDAQIKATKTRLRLTLLEKGKLQNGIRIRDLTESELGDEFEKRLPNAVVDRGILCFHGSGKVFGGADFTSEMKDSMSALDENGRCMMPPSLRWKEKSVIGVWIDTDSLEIGIVQDGIDNRCKHTVFKYEDYAFIDSRPDVNVTWQEDNIVPCISGRAVNIKVNLGLQEGGKNNDFKFFSRELLNFNCNQSFDTSLKKIKYIENGVFHTHERHNLKDNEFICLKFPSQKSEMPSTCSLQEQRPYRVRIRTETSFGLREIVPENCYQTELVMHPRIFLTGKVSFATFAPCVLVSGQKPVDVTARWNEIFEKEKIRQISLNEVVLEDGSKRPISNGLADIFCDPNTGLHLFPNVSCELKIFPRYHISDMSTSQCKFSYSRCQGFVVPSQEGLYAQVVPNFAFSDGSPVIPDYQSLVDMIFFSKLPCAFRASCVEILRTAYMDQEPWFVTPPINIFRADRARGQSNAAATPAGTYDYEQLTNFGYMHQQSCSDGLRARSAYSEADVQFFEDLYHAACWEAEIDFGQTPEIHLNDFGNKNWNETLLAKKKVFLLQGYKSPPGVFQLTTRDIVVFWGRAVSQVFEEKLKKKVFTDRNQDSKIFIKHLIDCLIVTVKFEFDESWKGIISVRSKMIHRLQHCVLSYLKEVGVAQDTAESDLNDHYSGEDSLPTDPMQNRQETSILSASWQFILKLFPQHESHVSAFLPQSIEVQQVASESAERKHHSYSSRIPFEILRHANFVTVQTLRSLANSAAGDKSNSIQSLIQNIESYEVFSGKRGNPNRIFTFVDWERKWSEVSPSLTDKFEQPSTLSHNQVKASNLFLHQFFNTTCS
jgi:hypothetical protein